MRTRRISLVAGLLLIGIALILISIWLGDPTPTPALAQSPKAEIVYLNHEDGTIRVLDLPAPGQVQWVSPAEDGAWRDFEVADVNGDGDYEIVAIRREIIAGFNFAIYDPVVAPDDDILVELGEIINEIPWKRLFTAAIPGTLTAVGAGDLDASIPGDEIVLGGTHPVTDDDEDAPDLPNFIEILQRDPATPNATNWLVQQSRFNTHGRWHELRVGQIDGVDNAELVGVDEEGPLHVYRVDGHGANRRLVQIFENVNRTRQWLSADIGQFYPGGPAELAAVRRAPLNLPSFWIFKYEPNGKEYIVDARAELMLPSPQYVFFADVNGNGDEEVFLLRDPPQPQPPTPTPATWPNFIMRNSGGDGINAFEIDLGRDLDFQAGAAGDVDGDGRAEVMVVRTGEIRVFTSPENSVASENHAVPSANHIIRAADLNRNGAKILPRLLHNPTTVPVMVVNAGLSNSQPLNFTSNQPSKQINWTARLEDNPPWLSVSPTSGTTPSNLQLFYDAYGLAPLTTVNATLVLEGTNPEVQVANSPLRIPISMNVIVGLYPQPARVVVPLNCPVSQPFSTMLTIGGLRNVPFSAEILPSSANWITMTANSTLLPTDLTLQIDPRKGAATDPIATAEIQVNATTNTNVPISIRVPVSVVCGRAFLPMILR